jgi:hypothetical protein
VSKFLGPLEVTIFYHVFARSFATYLPPEIKKPTTDRGHIGISMELKKDQNEKTVSSVLNSFFDFSQTNLLDPITVMFHNAKKNCWATAIR